MSNRCPAATPAIPREEKLRSAPALDGLDGVLPYAVRLLLYDSELAARAARTRSGGRSGRPGTIQQSVIYKKFVTVGDPNAAGTLYGGIMMSWVDEAAAILASDQK